MNISYSIIDNSEDTYTFRLVNGSFEFVDSLSSYCVPLCANQEHSISDYVCTGFPESRIPYISSLLKETEYRIINFFPEGFLNNRILSATGI